MLSSDHRLNSRNFEMDIFQWNRPGIVGMCVSRLRKWLEMTGMACFINKNCHYSMISPQESRFLQVTPACSMTGSQSTVTLANAVPALLQPIRWKFCFSCGHVACWYHLHRAENTKNDRTQDLAHGSIEPTCWLKLLRDFDIHSIC